MSLRCPLCGEPEPRRVAGVDARVLAREYRRVLGVDVRCPGLRIDLDRCERCDLAFFTPPCPAGEELYRALQRRPWYYQEDKPEYRLAAASVTAADAVLEVGGGPGAFAAHLDCRSYRLLELSPAAVEAARGRGLDAGAESVQEEAGAHPEAYDVVCAFQVLEHVPAPRDFVAASLACLRPGGRLILSVPGDESFVGRERHNLLNLPPHHLTRWSDRSLAALGARFGLDLLALEHDALAPWHALPYASHLVDEALAAALGRRWQPLDPLLVTTPVRAVRAALRLLPYPVVRLRLRRLRGHSTTVVYRKLNWTRPADRPV